MRNREENTSILEKVYVETPVDTDGDGKLDLIAVYIRRPQVTLRGERVPAIYVANPYMMSCNEDWYIPHDVNQEVKAYPTQNIQEEELRFDFSRGREAEPLQVRETTGFADHACIDEEPELECISEVYDYFNQRGYASVFCAGLGTRDSEGLTLTGSREEILAFKSVIDWLNGRCRAFTNKTDNIEVKAGWCTGNVAMSAKSYLGTMCIGVAATGVCGLKTIIPEAAISNWYAYYRYNGLNVPALGWQGDDLDILAKYCFSRAKDPLDYEKVKGVYRQALDRLEEGEDRLSANYNRFWDERNYLNQVPNIKASVLIIHGINDWNVKTNQCIPFFKALEKFDIQRKMILHQGEHVYIYHLKGSSTLEIMERWLEHYLYGIENGIEGEAKVLVESNLDQGLWMKSDTWPPAGWAYEQFPIEGKNESQVIVDDLSKTVYDKKEDNLADWLQELILSEETSYRNRLKFLWNPIAEANGPLRITGTVKVSFDAVIDKPTAILSAMLVDLGKEKRLTAEEVKAENGEFTFGYEAEPSAFKVISRGWLNAQNRESLWSKQEIVQGRKYHYSFDMVPTDHTLAEGHQLGLILYGIDAEATQRPDTVTHIVVDTASIDVKIPLLR